MVRKISIFKRALLSSSSMELGVVFSSFLKKRTPRTSSFCSSLSCLWVCFLRFVQKKNETRTQPTPDAAFFWERVKENFFSFLFLRLLFQLNWRLFDREIDILRPDKNVRTVNEKASVKFNFSNALSFAENDQQ